jgi:hypothetical protein
VYSQRVETSRDEAGRARTTGTTNVRKHSILLGFAKAPHHLENTTHQSRIERPALAAADRTLDALFAARAALRRAIALRDSATLQADQLKALVDRLEAEGRG